MPHARSIAKQVLRRIFEYGQRIGVDILPRHFYSEIPDIRQLRSTTEWRRPYSMIGVQGADPDAQLAFVRSVCTEEVRRVVGARAIREEAQRASGEVGFGGNVADFLYAFVVTLRPRRIVQVGCGVSTAVCLRAASDAGYSPEMTCVEPYPSAYLREQSRQGRIELIAEKVQAIGVDFLAPLSSGDLFFVDSSHALGPAGEVSRIVLELLPRLPAGCYAHFHDIGFPYDYPRNILTTELFFGHESALLHAFLVGNRDVAIAASLSMLHYARPGELKELLPNYRPAANDFGMAVGPGDFPSSLYLKVLAATVERAAHGSRAGGAAPGEAG